MGDDQYNDEAIDFDMTPERWEGLLRLAAEQAEVKPLSVDEIHSVAVIGPLLTQDQEGKWLLMLPREKWVKQWVEYYESKKEEDG
jgi:hypothetical protein